MNISKKTHTQTVPTYPDLGQVGSLLGTAWDTCDTHQENGLSSTKFFLFNRNSNAADKHQNQTNNTKMNKGCNIKVFLFYRTISLISNPSKVMLKIILNRLKPQAEKIIAEEQAGFRAGRIFNLRFLCDKYLPCLHRLQEGLRQGLACGFVGTQ